MSARPPASILVLTIFSFGNLYVPQPLLPLLAANFGVSAADASLLITVTMLPLAVAPLVYGYILEGIPARQMITAAGVLLALCHAGVAIADQWWQIVLLRSLAGLCLPAVFTALMSNISATARDDQVRQAMAWYIAATIVGGFIGRALSGFLSDLIGWRLVFVFWSTGVFLYIASYYMGGTIGSWVAPEVYRIWGWTAQLSLLALVLCGAATGLFFMLRQTASD